MSLPLALQAAFRDLVEGLQLDVEHDLLSLLAMRFTHEATQRIHETQRVSVPLTRATAAGLRDYYRVHELLAGYGLGLTAMRLRCGAILLGARILPRHPSSRYEHHLLAFPTQQLEMVTRCAS